jgi:HlyD family secretion protein
MKKCIVTLLVLAVIGVGGWQGWIRWKPKKQEAQWRTRKIERGEIVQEVRATGTVKPIKNILVGTQVNGPIKKLYVDFNAEVKAGQQIAQIDAAVYQATVSKDEATLTSAKANVLSSKANNAQAHANVELTQTKLALAEKELARMKQLR